MRGLTQVNRVNTLATQLSPGVIKDIKMEGDFVRLSVGRTFIDLACNDREWAAPRHSGDTRH